MDSKFLRIDQEKQDRILNAALNVFADNGYEKASTNQIVKEAGISKGLLFHYFKNKKELFLYTYKHFERILVDDFYSKFNLDEGDIFLKLKQSTILKMKLIKINPNITNFFLTAYFENSEEVKEQIEESMKELTDHSYSRLFREIDVSQFKEGININKAIDIIVWTMDGFANRYQEGLKGATITKMEEVIEELELYIETLRQSFYK